MKGFSKKEKIEKKEIRIKGKKKKERNQQRCKQEKKKKRQSVKIRCRR